MADITGVKPITNATVSTNIQILLGTSIIGYIRTLTESQTRPATSLYEIGTVGIVEQIPGQPGPVTLAVTKVATYHKNLINAIASLLNIDSVSDIDNWDIPRGMTATDVKNALTTWYGKMSTVTTPQAVYALQYLPLGFTLKVTETNPAEVDQITTYHGCFITRYSRPIVSSGELVVAETADISARYVDYK
jgi:hypothetical protein